MDLAELQRHWDTFGLTDPYWAILTDPSKRGNRWSPDEFFETGRLEVAAVLDHAVRLGVPRQWRRALDFGCGAGRLTQALGDRFGSVVGVDVAPSMIALAQTHNRHGGRCNYEVNDRPDLSRWPDDSIDLVYTSRVLQHIEPRYSTSYLREFVRVLAPGGLLSFDLPSASGEAAALADGSVPASAMRARLTVTPSGPLVVSEGAVLRVTVAVRNLSDVVWRAAPGRELNVGNQWLDRSGEMVRQDDRRVTLPTPLAPGAEVRVEMAITTPTARGAHLLRFDVVQEGVAWFASCGSEAAEVRLKVTDDMPASVMTKADVAVPDAGVRVAPSPDLAGLDPVMEMHAVPRDEVEALLREAGAHLMEVQRVHHCGPQWLAFRYDATK